MKVGGKLGEGGPKGGSNVLFQPDGWGFGCYLEPLLLLLFVVHSVRRRCLSILPSFIYFRRGGD